MYCLQIHRNYQFPRGSQCQQYGKLYQNGFYQQSLIDDICKATVDSRETCSHLQKVYPEILIW